MIHDIDELLEHGSRGSYRARLLCNFGSSQKQTSQHQDTTSNTIDPQQMALYQQNYAGAQQRANSLTPYNGQLVAGFNPTQTQAQGVLSGIGTDPFYGQAYDKAMGVNSGILGNPANPTITAQAVHASPIAAGQLATTDLSPYLNPYTNDVINASLAQLNQQRGQQQVADNAAATAAGAFGGDRQAVQRALTSQLYDQNTGSLVAGLNSQNFSQAQQAALNDINNRLGADQFNSTQGLQAGEFNSGQNFNAQQNTFNNSLANNQFQLGAANNYANLANQKLALAAQQGGILGAVGDAQQQQAQNELNAAFQAYANGQNLTIQQQQLLNQALGMIPLQQTTNSSGTSSSETKSNPGMGGVLAGLGSLAMGAATGGASLGLTGALGGMGSMGLGQSILGSLTGSNAAGYGGMFGAAAPTVSQIPMSLPGMSSLSLPRYA